MSFLRTISDSREKLCSRHLELFYLRVYFRLICTSYKRLFAFFYDLYIWCSL